MHQGITNNYSVEKTVRLTCLKLYVIFNLFLRPNKLTESMQINIPSARMESQCVRMGEEVLSFVLY